LGVFLGILWKFFWYFLVIILEFLGNSFGMFGKFFWNFLGILRILLWDEWLGGSDLGFFGRFLRILWEFFGNSIRILWEFFWNSIRILWEFYQNSL
jgi:hypothetical protein